jgi:hypothetical protein
MAKRYILYFTAEGHYVYASAGKQLELAAEFSGDEAGVAEFRKFLREQRGGLFCVLADLAGEDFHEDQIPLLRGADRDAVVQRRLAQRYRDTRLAAAISLGPVRTAERRNERLLLASFTNTQQLAPWLDALEESDARLAGVYSVPLLAPVLAARLGVKGGRCFVVTANRAGLRQCYVEAGKLRFARLEHTGEMTPQALALFVRSETQRLAQYLATLRVLPREGAPVKVVVVAPPGEGALFEQALGSDARLQFQTIDMRQAARMTGLSGVPEGAAAEALYLHLAARKPPREQFANRDDRRRYVIWRLQRAIVGAGALGFAACALYASAHWMEAAAVRERAAMQAQEARTAAEQYARITAAFPATQTSNENVKVAVAQFKQIAEHSASPDSALAHVSRALERFPQMELDALNWSVGGAGEKPAAAPASGEKPLRKGETALRLELTGRVNATQRGDYRGITAQVQRFATALGVSGYELARTQLPFDITSEGTLTGDIGAASQSGEAPRFTVVLVRRLP